MVAARPRHGPVNLEGSPGVGPRHELDYVALEEILAGEEVDHALARGGKPRPDIRDRGSRAANGTRGELVLGGIGHDVLTEPPRGHAPAPNARRMVEEPRETHSGSLRQDEATASHEASPSSVPFR